MGGRAEKGGGGREREIERGRAGESGREGKGVRERLTISGGGRAGVDKLN